MFQLPTRFQSAVFPVGAYVYPPMAVGKFSFDYEEIKKKFSHLSALPNSSFNLMKLGIILGQDDYDLNNAGLGCQWSKFSFSLR